MTSRLQWLFKSHGFHIFYKPFNVLWNQLTHVKDWLEKLKICAGSFTTANVNNVWTTTLVPFYQDHRTPIPWNFRCFQALLCSGSQHQPAQSKSTIADKNNTIKCRIKDAIAIINKEKPLWIGTRDWTSQPLTILSCRFITTFLWCHLRLHNAKEVQAIQTKYLFFVSNFALVFEYYLP